MFNRNNVGLLGAEFVGTFILSAVALGAASFFSFTAPWYVALSVAVTLATLVATIGNVSGAHVNPAISIGLWTLQKITTKRALGFVIMQLLGGFVALKFLEYVTNTITQGSGASTFDMRVFTAELVGAAIFGFGVAAAVLRRLDGIYAAYTIGASLFLGVVVASLAAPGFINPAVAIANNSLSWTVAIAPLLGAVLGMNIYSMLFAPSESLLSRKSTARSKS